MRHQTVRQVKLILIILSYILLLQAQQLFAVSSVLSDHVNTPLFCANMQTLAVD